MVAVLLNFYFFIVLQNRCLFIKSRVNNCCKCWFPAFSFCWGFYPQSWSVGPLWSFNSWINTFGKVAFFLNNFSISFENSLFCGPCFSDSRIPPFPVLIWISLFLLCRFGCLRESNKSLFIFFDQWILVF